MATLSNPQQLLEKVRNAPEGVQQLCALLAVLRGPGGCPWDLEQTHQTLAPYLLEETYETIDAIDSGDQAGLIEELGDLLLQVVFHAQLGNENGEFDLNKIAQLEVEKMIERHPHVFEDIDADSAEDVRQQWEARKRSKNPRKSLADGVPRAMPALTRAHTISARASGLGFDWTNSSEVLPKIQEEFNELSEEFHGQNSDQTALEDELGDMMFAAVNFARKANIDPEAALRKATNKFVRRFDAMDKPDGSRMDGGELMKSWDNAWVEAKKQVG